MEGPSKSNHRSKIDDHRRELEAQGAQRNRREATCSNNTQFYDAALVPNVGVWSGKKRTERTRERQERKNASNFCVSEPLRD